MTDAADVIRDVLAAHELTWEEPSRGTFAVTLPGTHKLQTTCSLMVGEHSVSVNAFVARCPDENHGAVHQWLLQHNARMYGVAFAIDHHGDIYLVGHLSLGAVTGDEIDRILGAVLEYADASFNRILELGFETSIRREWDWRLKRGESTANLEAFTRLAERPVRPVRPD